MLLCLLQVGWLVIAPAEWEAELKPLVAARAAQGFTARFLALEDAVGGDTQGDAPERIKRRLYEEWHERGLTHALLVGDADVFPVRFMVLDRGTAPAFNYAFYACDLYYADLARNDGSLDDWNVCADGFHARYFGEVRGEFNKSDPINYDGISYLPEIAVGRWPVSTREELRAVVAKTLTWDAAPPARSALLLHAGEWVDERPRLGARAEDLTAAGWAVERQFYDTASAPTPERITTALKAGVGLALHAGHGFSAGWHLCLASEHEAILAAAPPAIYFSVGCSTANFVNEPPYQSYLDADGLPHRGTNDGEVFTAPPPPPAPLQPVRFNSSSFGERMLRMPAGGAAAYVGCVTGSQPAALSLMDGFLIAAAAGAPTVGEAWSAAVRHYHAAERLEELQPNADWYPPSIYFQGMKFILYGDPALAMPRPAVK